MNLMRKGVTVTSSLIFFFLCYFFLYQSILSNEDSSVSSSRNCAFSRWLLRVVSVCQVAVTTPLQLFTR
jgi:hypothetical protein